MAALASALDARTQTIEYPERDGSPMADNTEQFDWIVKIKLGLEAIFADQPEVFVAGDLLWYPVEGDNKTRAAPDVLVAFGRPKGKRGSYKQWEENHTPPQVVFEVLSPGNTVTEMTRKHTFYDEHGVEEYYVYDPDHGELSGWIRRTGRLRPIEPMDGWISPRLGIRFEMAGSELRLFRPDGQPFETYVELAARVEQERERAEQERQRAERLAGRLRELGIDPET